MPDAGQFFQICSGHLGLQHLVSLNFFFFKYSCLQLSYNTCNTLSSPGPDTKAHWKWKCFDIMQGNSDSVVNPCCSQIHRSPYFCWVCKTGSLVDRTNTYEPKHRSGDLRDKYQRLPVKGDFVSELPLSYEPVDNIITHVGFSSFHAFNIYAAFGWIKVVLQHWSRWWILPKEFISNLFPETWNGAIVCISATGCMCLRCAREIGPNLIAWRQQNFKRCTNKTCVLDLPSGFSRDFLYSAR